MTAPSARQNARIALCQITNASQASSARDMRARTALLQRRAENKEDTGVGDRVR